MYNYIVMESLLNTLKQKQNVENSLKQREIKLPVENDNSVGKYSKTLIRDIRDNPEFDISQFQKRLNTINIIKDKTSLAIQTQKEPVIENEEFEEIMTIEIPKKKPTKKSKQKPLLMIEGEDLGELSIKPIEFNKAEELDVVKRDNDNDDKSREDRLREGEMEKTEALAVDADVALDVKAKKSKKRLENTIVLLPNNKLLDVYEGESILDRLPKKSESVHIKQSSYYMNNREIFINFINSMFRPYREEVLDDSAQVTCESISSGKSGEFNLLTHQKLVRDYLNLYTPYRGLFLFFSLGSGKTCSSIAIAEGMKSTKKILVLTPASLETNYRDELKKCGDPLYRTNQCWEWVDTKENPDMVSTLSSVLNLSIEYINEKGGAWLVNVNKNMGDCKKMTSSELSSMRKKMKKTRKNKKEDSKGVTKRNRDNLEELEDQNELDVQMKRQSLNEQIDTMIESKYQFIHYNGLRRDKLKKMTNNFENNIFDNTVVIIDEVHNFISRIVNKIDKRKPVSLDKHGNTAHVPMEISLILYDMLLRAQNTRLVLLTGTPIINYPNELGILFNILRGYIKTWEIPVDPNNEKPINKEMLHEIFKREKTLDYWDYSNTSRKLLITRNPYGFENKEKREGGYKGVSNETKNRVNEKGEPMLDERGTLTDAEFERKILKILKVNDINIIPSGITIHMNKSLPDRLDDFSSWFIEDGVTKVKNVDLFKKRIMGTTSYYRSTQEKLLPKYEKAENFKVIKIPMSNEQFAIYEVARVQERKQEKQTKKNTGKVDKDGVFKEPSSTYRIFSRLFCNFVMPPDIGRPFPRQGSELEEGRSIEGEDVETSGTGIGTFYQNVIEQTDKIEKEYEADGEKDNELEGDEVIDKMADSSYERRLKLAMEKLKLNASEYLRPEGLEIYSPKYLQILENIQNPENVGLHLLYSQFRTLEGIGIFKLVLEENGFTQFKIKKDSNGIWEIDIAEEDKGKPTFVLYTGTESTEEKSVILNIYNGNWDSNVIPSSISTKLRKMAANNNMGEIIKLIMITASGSEGISLANTRYVHIMEPYWHPVRTEQVVGRARRICSHKNLPEELQTVEVFMYLMTFTKEQLSDDRSIELKLADKSKRKYKMDESPEMKYIPFTSDEALFEISTIKEGLSEQLITAIKESSIDCAVYSKISGKEQLKCLQFGEPTANTFSYNPSISMDGPDSVSKLNKKTVEWGAEEFTYKGKTYAYRTMRDGNDRLYDLDSFLRAQQVVGVEPIYLGYVVKNRGKIVDVVLNPI